MSDREPERVTLELRALPGSLTPPSIRLRQGLKFLLRACRWRCTRMTFPTEERTTEGGDRGE